MTNKATLFNQLEMAKIKHNDIILMHSSMKKIGEFEGGINGLIDAFIEYLYDGLFILPTHTWDKVTKNNPFFDVKKSVPCVGIIPRMAILRNDCFRSHNSTHSVVAFGKKAKEFVANESLVDTPTSPNGCYGKLIELDGKILLCGVNHCKNTFIHSLEEIAYLKNRLTDNYTTFYDIDENGTKIEHKMKEIYCPYHEDVSKEFFRLNELFEKNNINTYCQIGNASSIVCSAKKLAELLLPIMREKAEIDSDYLLPKEYEEYKLKRNNNK